MTDNRTYLLRLLQARIDETMGWENFAKQSGEINHKNLASHGREEVAQLAKRCKLAGCSDQEIDAVLNGFDRRAKEPKKKNPCPFCEEEMVPYEGGYLVDENNKSEPMELFMCISCDNNSRHKIVKLGEMKVNEYLLDETGTYSQTIIYVKYKDEQLLEEWVKENYPRTSCTHAWDCCGNWYSHGGKILHKEGGLAIIRVSWYVNC